MSDAEESRMSGIPRMGKLREASQLSGISYDALRKMCLRGEIAHIRCGTKFLINLDQLAEYLNQCGKGVSSNE